MKETNGPLYTTKNKQKKTDLGRYFFQIVEFFFCTHPNFHNNHPRRERAAGSGDRIIFKKGPQSWVTQA